MSNTSNQTTISFTYDDPNSIDGPPFIIVEYKGQPTFVVNNNTPVLVKMDPVPPVENGMLTMIFDEDFYPITLYFDGFSMWISALTDSGSFKFLIPFHFDTEMNIILFPLSAGQSQAEVRMIINGPPNQEEIGILIVGTGGLTEPEE
jgi:hypothetical protein